MLLEKGAFFLIVAFNCATFLFFNVYVRENFKERRRALRLDIVFRSEPEKKLWLMK